MMCNANRNSYGGVPVAPVERVAAAVAAPRIRLSVLLPLPVIQTLPPRSMAMPAGVVEPVA